MCIVIARLFSLIHDVFLFSFCKTGHEDSTESISVQLKKGGAPQLLGGWIADCMGEAAPPDEEDDDEKLVRRQKERKMVMEKACVVEYDGYAVEPPKPLGEWLDEVHKQCGVAQLKNGTKLWVYWYVCTFVVPRCCHCATLPRRCGRCRYDQEQNAHKEPAPTKWWAESYSSDYDDYGVWYMAEVMSYSPSERSLKVCILHKGVDGHD